VLRVLNIKQSLLFDSLDGVACCSTSKSILVVD
jgi:hypothetical protein